MVNRLEGLSFISLFSLMWLSACTVGPDFERPSLPDVRSYNAGGDPSLTEDQRLMTTKEAKRMWWTDFGCQSLNTLVQEALLNNRDLKVSKARLAQAEEMVKAELGTLWPSLEIDGAAGRQKYGVTLLGPASLKIPPFNYYEIGPAVNMPLDLFGGHRRSIEKQKALAEYEGYELKAASLALVGDVVMQAFAMASLKEQVTIYEKMIKIDETSLALIKKAFEIGTANKNDILAAENQLAADRGVLPALRQQLTVARNTLAILIGRAPALGALPDFDLNHFVLPRDLPLTLPSELVHQRPDILAAEANLHAANAAIGIATANLYPQVTLTATFMQEALTPQGLFNAANNAWSFAGNIAAPLFKGGTLEALKKQSEEAYQATLAAYEQTVFKAFGDVANNLKALQHTQEEFISQKRLYGISENSLRLAQRAYDAESASMLKIYEAERQYLKAKLAYIQAQTQRYQTTAGFFVALGQL